ncbi:MAG: O-antigen ligase family protein [Cyclobacteriaceae bacterium]|nr:O-antigen ligase family protein [Cyclobacteriaceae bacterium]
MNNRFNDLSALSNSPSLKGRLGFVVALSIILSTSTEYRIELGPLLIHAYLLLIPVVLLLTSFQIQSIERHVIKYLVLFTVTFSTACVFSIEDIPHLVKVVAATITFIFFAQSVNNYKDFWLISYGIIFCSIYLGVKTILISDQFTPSRISTGVVALEGIGNKNAQSLYMLPGLFFSSWIFSDSLRTRRLVLTLVHGIFLIVMAIGLILTANRSGWLAGILIMIFFLFKSGINFRVFLFLPLLYLVVSFYVENFALDIVDRKYEQTFVTSYSADKIRYFLLSESILAGLHNPFLGYGPIKLAEHLAESAAIVGYRGKLLDPHNLYGYLLGGSGIFSFTFFFLFLFGMVRYKPIKKIATRNTEDVRRLLIFFILIFLLRGFFTREILYSPTFISSLAILYGFYRVEINQVSNQRLTS